MQIRFDREDCPKVDLELCFSSANAEGGNSKFDCHVLSCACMHCLLIKISLQVVWHSSPQNENEDIDNDVYFVGSIDGVHFRINEPRKEPSSSWFSHKSNGPGLTYEIVMSIYTSKVLWANGPFPAGKSDISMFREGGLLERMPEGGRLVGDEGYRGEPGFISTQNNFDSDELADFKKRARARHETFNGRLKNFAILSDVFRHNHKKHQIVFDSVCAIAQYEINNNHPLFDV